MKKSLVFPITSIIMAGNVLALPLATANIAKPNITLLNENSSSVKKASQDEIDKAKLLEILSKITSFTADFEQSIYDEESNALQVSIGNIIVKKPNLVNWHTKSPDENQILSDGKSLWLFDPFIEQVTAYALDASLTNTPILLLSSNDQSLWQQYDIKQTAIMEFVIKSIDDNSQVKELTIVFDETGTAIKKFIILDATGQRSEIALSAFTLNPALSNQIFNFVVPEGVQLDDQR
ncbi:outer membrane lipoprotein chaperone LolA [Thalassotalea atypica]|uniref:outer membrane lipoprotein chaperone LolA n=1 Tax=Thalassotalea atypica TaxID=2054316 RepID=UPI0025740433|nr:outer membrane lipoprotein chaperone LolA [Thalassotalea atypica]